MKFTKIVILNVVLAVLFSVLSITAITQSVTAQSEPESPTRFVVPFSGETLARVAVAIFLAAVAEFLVDGLIKPVWDKFKIDTFWLRYIAWAVASGIVALSGVNLFAGYIPSMIVGQILTAVFCGGGSNKIHDFFDRYVSKKKANAVHEIAATPTHKATSEIVETRRYHDHDN